MAKKTKSKSSKADKSILIKENILNGELERFIEYHPPSRFSRNLRNMLLEFLMYDGAIEANYLNDLLYDLDGLFRLLDAIQEKN